MAANADVDPKVIKVTQDTLGKVIKKPQMTDKLLKRPPFRFIHDIVANIIGGTGLLKGLYTDSELVADSISDKESKVAFLQKAIDAVIFMTGDPLPVKASKIVAGLEPEKTNQFLQALGKLAGNSVDSADSVARVLKGDKPTTGPTGGPKKPAAAKKVDKTVAGTKTPKTDGSKNRSRGNVAEKPTTKAAPPRNSVSKPLAGGKNKTTTTKATTKQAADETKAASKATPPSSATSNKENPSEQLVNAMNGHGGEIISSSDAVKGDPDNDEAVNGDMEANGEERPTKANGYSNDAILQELNDDVAPAAKPQQRPLSDRNDLPALQLTVRPPTGVATTSKAQPPQFPPSYKDDTEMRSRSARPTTARAAPPKVVLRREVIEQEMPPPEVTAKKEVENLIMAGQAADDQGDDDDTFLVQVAPAAAADEDPLKPEEMAMFAVGSSNKGSLVKQLMETKKELEGIDQTDPTVGDDAGKMLAARDIEKMKQTIQNLTRLANPLGRVLDYLQEDIDTMTAEKATWEKECETNVRQIEKERDVIDNDLIPLRDTLTQLDVDIAEEMEKIVTVKAVLFKNLAKLDRMINMAIKC